MKKSYLIYFFLALAIILSTAWFLLEKGMIGPDQVPVKNKGDQEDKQNNLVWYQVPELGVQFKATLDSKNDLKYTMVYDERKKWKAAYFYSQSIHDFDAEQGIPCKFYQADPPRSGQESNCSSFVIYRVDAAGNVPPKCDGWSIKGIETEKYSICYSNSQSDPVIFSGRDKYNALYKDKHFQVFLDSLVEL